MNKTLFRKTHNFTQYYVLIDESCYDNSFLSRIILYFIGIENIITNEILYLFSNSSALYIKNAKTNDKYAWSVDDLNYYYWKDGLIICLFNRFLVIIKIIVGLFMVSNITSIYIKMAMVCSPIAFLLLSKYLYFIIN